ncbi:RNA recognition motif 2-domain-containing protein [Kockovaella imperatae]|uniref:RNA recognition motif 2-domain-containing protein n=1 Tax=Kockovaella imperatae TaxID=4999 RepID=A0A1Y1UQP9_9TREE|nr:RNA recognition motif 2-domain-containing protein [Kockovaella imperatae]ORX39804.1 RNA recognition motif 2-domain-containing protein [Kockovaella imperatae]
MPDMSAYSSSRAARPEVPTHSSTHSPTTSTSSSHHSEQISASRRGTVDLDAMKDDSRSRRSSPTSNSTADHFAVTMRGMSKLSFSPTHVETPVVKTPVKHFGQFGNIGDGCRSRDEVPIVQSSASSIISKDSAGREISPFSSTYSASSPPTSVAPSIASHSAVAPQPPVFGLPFFPGDKSLQNESAAEIGRYLMISQIPKEVTPSEIRIKIGAIVEYKAIIVKHLQTRGVAVVTFWDPRQALQLYQRLHAKPMSFIYKPEPVHLQCMRIEKQVAAEMMANVNEPGDWEAPLSCVSLEVVGEYVVSLEAITRVLDSFGTTMWVQALGSRRFLAEFYDSRHAALAVRSLDQFPVYASHITAILLSEETRGTGASTATPPPSSRSRSWSATPQLIGAHEQQQRASFSTPQHLSGHDVFWSPATDHSSTLMSSYGTPVTPSTNTSPSPGSWGRTFEPYGAETPSSASRHRSLPPPVKITPGYSASPGWSSPYGGSQEFGRRPSGFDGLSSDRVPPQWELMDRKRVPEQNVVKRERILSGLDPRTTVMIKDVPNKLSRNELIGILNDVVPGGFDFVYLRFDFKNHCNVGYAFVNFVSVKSLYEFHVAKVGKRWNLFSSEKVLQICYATIQGKQALINKFRNSAVMDVIEEWRPQIFYSSGTRQGLPEPFPESDNPAQRYRSTAARLFSLSNPSVPHPHDTSEQYSYDFIHAAHGTGF